MSLDNWHDFDSGDGPCVKCGVLPSEETPCPAGDGSVSCCEHWFDGGPCCKCGRGACHGVPSFFDDEEFA